MSGMTNSFIARKWLWGVIKTILWQLHHRRGWSCTLVCVHGYIDHTHLHWQCSELWHQRVDRKHTKCCMLQWRRLQSRASLYVQSSWQGGGVQPPKPPHSGYATGTLQELAIVIFLFTCMQLNYTLLGLIKTNPVTNVLSRVQTDDIQLVILSFLWLIGRAIYTYIPVLSLV